MLGNLLLGATPLGSVLPSASGGETPGVSPPKNDALPSQGGGGIIRKKREQIAGIVFDEERPHRVIPAKKLGFTPVAPKPEPKPPLVVLIALEPMRFSLKISGEITLHRDTTEERDMMDIERLIELAMRQH